MALKHGGNVHAAAAHFGLPLEQWVDLSTGISPWSWPVPELPQHVWQTLPYSDEQLEHAAAACYGCAPEAVLAVPGSQYALQCAPALLRTGRVAMPLRGYTEHRQAWANAGHEIVDYADTTALRELVTAAAVDHVLVINPNNPTGECISANQLLALHRQLGQRDGTVVVDEAFADLYPQCSVASQCPLPGLVVYRSVGKFFGLAGIRLGFMLAPTDFCLKLQSLMPPWLLAHPARWIGTAALRDQDWQCEQRARLTVTGAQWVQTLQQTIAELQFTQTALFASGFGAAAYCRDLYAALGRRAILVRLFEDIDGRAIVRFGLPLPTSQDRVVELIREAVEECQCGTG